MDNKNQQTKLLKKHKNQQTNQKLLTICITPTLASGEASSGTMVMGNKTGFCALAAIQEFFQLVRFFPPFFLSFVGKPKRSFYHNGCVRDKVDCY